MPPGTASAQKSATLCPAAVAASVNAWNGTGRSPPATGSATGVAVAAVVVVSSCLLRASKAVHSPNFAGPFTSGPTPSVLSVLSVVSAASSAATLEAASAASTSVDSVVETSVLDVVSPARVSSVSSSALCSVDVAASGLDEENGVGTTPAAAAAPADISVTTPIVAIALPVRILRIIGRVLAVEGSSCVVTTAAPKATSAECRPWSSAGSAGPRRASNTALISATSWIASAPGAPLSSRSASSGEIRGGVTSSRSSQPLIALQRSLDRAAWPVFARRDVGSP